ncbi:zinc finger protein 398-like, partial [Rhinatrema bivittatum]
MQHLELNIGNISGTVPALASVTFHDVAVYFSEVEWAILEEWKKDVYKNVMKEVHKVLVSMGHTILSPEVLFLIKPEEEQHFKEHPPPRERSNHADPTSSRFVGKPDILLRIK